MSNLEQFIRNNREAFDSEEPSPHVFDRIMQPKIPSVNSGGRLVNMRMMRWIGVAAAIILLVAGGWYLGSMRSNSSATTGTTAKQDVKPATPKNNLPEVTTPDSAVKSNPPQQQLAQNSDSKSLEQKVQKAETKSDDEADSYKEEMFHYARLVEIKHNELKKIEKDEPLLYKQFSGDVHKLDSVYHSLEMQLPKNPNREQLLEAMIRNLQLQMELLNHQLDIIKQINHSKKAAYEQAYKTA